MRAPSSRRSPAWQAGWSRHTPPRRRPCRRPSWGSAARSPAWWPARPCRGRSRRRHATAHDAEPARGRAGGLPLARIAFAVYVLLVVYASLYPLEGWHDHGLSPFAYVGSPWPRNVMTLDVALNILGYLPYGFLCVAALYPRVRPLAAFGVALASAALLSLSLEAVQS